MVNKILFILLLLDYIHATIMSTISEQKLEEIRKSLEKRGYTVYKTEIKTETIHFTVKSTEEEILTAECKSTMSMDFDCIYRNSKNFRSKLEFFATLKNLHHHNHLQVYDVYEDVGFLCIIREHFKGGFSIKDSKLVNENKEILLNNLLRPIFYVLDYCIYLRNQCLYHGDIILENILINENGNIKICGLFSIKKSYFCQLPRKDNLLIKAFEETHDIYYGEDIDVKSLYDSITNVLLSCNNNSFINEEQAEFMESLKKHINISTLGLFFLINHEIFDNHAFIYSISDFRELDNFYRIEDSTILQKINKNSLILTVNAEGVHFTIIIEIMQTYLNKPSLLNSVNNEFLDISCYMNQEAVNITPRNIKYYLVFISSTLLVFQDVTSYVVFTYNNEIDVLYNPINDLVGYESNGCTFLAFQNTFRVKISNEVKFMKSISSDESYHSKLVLILLDLFRSIEVSPNDFKLEFSKIYENRITYLGEIPKEANNLRFTQLFYKVRLPYIFIDNVGTIEEDDGSYIYNLEKEFDHEIYEINGLFYKTDSKTLQKENIGLSEVQKAKTRLLKEKILIDSYLTVRFIGKFR